MEGVVMCGAWDVVSFKWLLESHHGAPLAQQMNLLLFIRSLRIHCLCHLLGCLQIATATESPLIPDGLTLEVRDLGIRCLELKPDDRPKSADLLKHALFRGMQ